MINKLFVLFLIVSNAILAQDSDAIFEKANTFYKDGKYDQAIDAYKEIILEDNISSELYYNLGNAYYKLNEVALTIYNYEKSLQLDPTNQDAQNNLIFAKKLTLDRIEPLPKSVFQQFNESVLQKLTYNSWAKITVLFSLLGSVLFLLFYLAYDSSKKRLFFTTSIISFILLIISLAITFQQYNQSKNNIEAIIFSEEVSIKSEPTKNSDEIFTLHEGTKVNIIDNVDNWKKIRLADGKIGWILGDKLKEI